MTPPIALLVPSRGRPHNARALIESWQATTEGKSWLWFLIDEDDPAIDGYHDVYKSISLPCNVGFWYDIPSRLVEWTNRAALDVAWQHSVLGSIGDDHRLSPGWETTVLEAFGELGSGFVYGDDGIHGPNLPTACFVTSDIVTALGWMAPPSLIHLFCDNAWLELGRAANCIRYVPELKTPHLHPLKGLAPSDATYEEGTSPEVWAKDSAAFEAWKRDGLEDAAAKIRALRA